MIVGNIVIFLVCLSKCCPKIEYLVLERDTNLVDLVFLLQEKHLILVAQHDCQPCPPSMKSSDFGVLTVFVTADNFCDSFGIFDHLES